MNGSPAAGLPVTSTRRAAQPPGNGDAVAVLSVAVRRHDHFTRLWPASHSGPSAGFLLAMLPMRLAALALLWITSAPRRLALPLALAIAVAARLLLSRYGHDLDWTGLVPGGR